MVVPDPVDVRLLSLLAELGRAAVHEVAARLGMDPREVASRLVALSGTGLPLVVGVECDQNGIRAALASGPPVMPPPAHGGYPLPGAPYGVPSGPHPVAGTPSGVYQVQGTPSGVYPLQGGVPQGLPSGPYPVQGTPSGPYPGPAYPAGPQYPAPPVPHPSPDFPPPMTPGPPSQPFPAQSVPPSQPFPAPHPVDPIMSTWGPPQSSSWARGDQQPGLAGSPRPAGPPNRTRTGVVGTTLEIDGLEGEYLTITLVEVVDPADYLFMAAGYRLQEGERAVVVHTEVTNRGAVPFSSLPDLYLVLVAQDGQVISKAPVSLSSRPPHRIGVAPGETAGGHTVYVLPEYIELRSVRWSPRPNDDQRSLTWTVEQ